MKKSELSKILSLSDVFSFVIIEVLELVSISRLREKFLMGRILSGHLESLCSSSFISSSLLVGQSFIPKLDIATLRKSRHLINMVSFFIVLISHLHLFLRSLDVLSTTYGLFLKKKCPKSFTFLAGSKVILKQLIHKWFIDT